MPILQTIPVLKMWCVSGHTLHSPGQGSTFFCSLVEYILQKKKISMCDFLISVHSGEKTLNTIWLQNLSNQKGKKEKQKTLESLYIKGRVMKQHDPKASIHNHKENLPLALICLSLYLCPIRNHQNYFISNVVVTLHQTKRNFLEKGRVTKSVPSQSTLCWSPQALLFWINLPKSHWASTFLQSWTDSISSEWYPTTSLTISLSYS